MSSESLALSEVEWVETSFTVNNERFLDSARNDRSVVGDL